MLLILYDDQVELFLPRIYVATMYVIGTALWRSWLGHCATSQKVAGSIPDGVIGIFH